MPWDLIVHVAIVLALVVGLATPLVMIVLGDLKGER